MENSFGSGKGGDTITSGIEGAWKPNPTKWDNGYFETLFKYDWKLTKARQALISGYLRTNQPPPWWKMRMTKTKRHAPMMTTADMAMKMDPIYEKISGIP